MFWNLEALHIMCCTIVHGPFTCIVHHSSGLFSVRLKSLEDKQNNVFATLSVFRAALKGERLQGLYTRMRSCNASSLVGLEQSHAHTYQELPSGTVNSLV